MYAWEEESSQNIWCVHAGERVSASCMGTGEGVQTPSWKEGSKKYELTYSEGVRLCSFVPT